MVFNAIFAALICVLAPMSVPIGTVPISLGLFAVLLAGVVLDPRDSVQSVALYLVLGAVGVPVFSGWHGGFQVLVGPTGGYLVGFILMALICGFVLEKSRAHAGITIVGMIVGTLVAYFFGTVWFVLEMQCQVWYALTVCVFPFIPFDLVKIVVLMIVGPELKKVLIRANRVSVQEHTAQGC